MKIAYVVDAQNDFCKPNGALYVKDAENTIEASNNFLKQMKPEDFIAAIFSFDTHTPSVYENSEEGKMFPPHCVEFTKGWELAVDHTLVNPQITKRFVKKDVFDVWQNKAYLSDNTLFNKLCDFEDYINELKSKTNTVVVFGHALNFCVRWAVEGFAKRGFKIELIENLCRGIDTGNAEHDLKAEYVFKDLIEKNILKIVNF